jgi:hypothetical protein
MSRSEKGFMSASQPGKKSEFLFHGREKRQFGVFSVDEEKIAGQG